MINLHVLNNISLSNNYISKIHDIIQCVLPQLLASNPSDTPEFRLHLKLFPSPSALPWMLHCLLAVLLAGAGSGAGAWSAACWASCCLASEGRVAAIMYNGPNPRGLVVHLSARGD